jgi:sulfatase modifying factor 1
MRNFVRSPWRPLVAAALWLWLAQGAWAVNFLWVPVGDPGNACDPQPWGCFGGVDYDYRIAAHEVTNAQYAEFLNAKAASDPHGLYNPNMANFNGGITRSGSDGSHSYSTIAGREAMPVNYVSVFDAMRFVNWVHNGQGDSDTETGAYTMPTSQFGLPNERNPGAWIFLPTNDEWHKAAYYDPAAGVFFDYAAGTDAVITCSEPTAQSNTANCGQAVGNFTSVGSYTDSPSPNGTFDQAGNIQEWTETEVEGIETWFIRGGSYAWSAEMTAASHQDDDYPDTENGAVGFRVASIEGGAGGTECGDSVCESPENSLTCPADCPEVCGGLCTGSETVNNCFMDCGFCGDDVCTGWENATTCPADCAPVCGDGDLEGNEECEAGVPLADTCESLGFNGGTLTCNASTCTYDTSDCSENQCLPSWASCSSDADCCSGDCTSWGWFRLCR